MKYKILAIVTFPGGGTVKKKFLYLNQIRMGFGDSSREPAKGLVLFSRLDGKHRAEVKVASSLTEYELASTRDLLTAVENLGADVEYF
ncbi:hypothetical protein [Micromonospora sp. CB01531]|uniref:hypothetical protein n=1 Tax=Micromonospora sp. CB01531 TaxID=1718947 RepID=UPI001160F999|nr:hypothetical protein [Micromonospora sp. CB01531]